jgi:hypothetical protein
MHLNPPPNFLHNFLHEHETETWLDDHHVNKRGSLVDAALAKFSRIEQASISLFGVRHDPLLHRALLPVLRTPCLAKSIS